MVFTVVTHQGHIRPLLHVCLVIKKQCLANRYTVTPFSKNLVISQSKKEKEEKLPYRFTSTFSKGC
jgi:hypothetical protein